MQRWTHALGWLALVATLLLSGGGVAVGDACCGGEPGAACEAGCQGGATSCEATSVKLPSASVAPALPVSESTIPLNTRGYNYGDPDEYRPAVPSIPAEPRAN